MRVNRPRTNKPQPRRHAGVGLVGLLGPAFVASVAYVDPGNVAANITAGARYGYLLVWVLVLSNLMAVFIQYQSAKLGIVTGKSLPAMMGDRLPRGTRIVMWAQAEFVAIATDLAEVVGGAIALNLLFDLPLLWGAVITGAVSFALLLFQGRKQRVLERVVIGLLVIIAFGFLAGILIDPPAPAAVATGLIPRFAGADSVLLSASMLGATVMPHAIYLHSALVNDRFGSGSTADGSRIARLLQATKVDVVWALAIAGAVNIGLLVLAANAFYGMTGTDSIEGAHAAIVATLGDAVGVIFAVGLLASGLASTSVGAYAGAEIIRGMLKVSVPMWVLRLISLIPALVVLAFKVSPTTALVWSQAILSLGIPFAIVPLFLATGSRRVMGKYADKLGTKLIAWILAGLIIALNVALVIYSVDG